jgi:hypothetical protein
LNPRERIPRRLLRGQRAKKTYLRGSKIPRSLLRGASIGKYMGDLKHHLTGKCRMNRINMLSKPKYIKNDQNDSYYRHT